jgi:excisionase family DNA binding protein
MSQKQTENTNDHEEMQAFVPKNSAQHPQEGVPAGSRNVHNSDHISGAICLENQLTEQQEGKRATNSRLLTAEEAAAYLRCSIRSIWEWKADGSLGYYRKGRYVRFSVSDLEEFKRKCYVPARHGRSQKRRMLRVDQEGRSA